MTIIKNLLLSLLILVTTTLSLGWLTGAFAGPQNALNNDRLPYYYQQNLQAHWDTWASWQRIARFSLVNQHGQEVDQTLLHHQPSFIGFFYAGCVTLCPISLEVLRELQTQTGRKKLMSPQFIMLTVTPEQDDASTMAAYAKKLKLPNDWTLLTGSSQQMQKLTASLMTDINLRTSNGEPLHGQRAFLLDARARIRGIYDASSMLEMRRMIRDYESLLQDQ
ncbi:SCO family protein [Undibacterium sp. Di27W]|uniref:SCO family protein n=1 Tax=Undibacterium sp. Di27W TaxID=3413036 RepID=UPI003BF3E93D